VGNDDNRDYRTLIKALPENIELVLVSKIKIDPMGKKVRQMSNISDLDLRDLYNQCQFAIIPSIKLNYESSGLSSSLQLAACQKALIISRAPTMEEVFEAGKDCLYYDPENVEDLKDKITTLWKNQELCLTLGLNAQNHAKAYDCENMAHQLESIISEI
jgi:glycosyltransferase involved in cell wall biosynthesis